MNDFYVYTYTVPGEDKPFYVGKGRGRRAYEHLKPATLARYDTYFYRKLRKLQSQGIRPGITIVLEGLTETEAFDREQSLIRQYGRKGVDGCLYNRTSGGEGAAKPEPETRAKMSASQKKRKSTARSRQRARDSLLGRKRSDETRYNQSAAAKARWERPGQKEAASKRVLEYFSDPANRQKIGNPWGGRKHTAESRRKMSEAKKGCVMSEESKNARGIPIESFDPATGRLVKRYSRIKLVAQDGLGIAGVSRVLRGRTKTYKQLGWRYACNISDTSTQRPP